MVLQVAADRQVSDAGDAHLAQMRGRAYSRKHQKLRRIERASRHDHIAARFRLLAVACIRDVLDAGRGRAAHEHARRMRTGLDVKIAAPACRPQIGARR
jgi:hypothetical protein